MRKKKYSFYYKVGYYINSFFALLLLLAYLLPYIKPEKLGSFAALSLITPVLLLVNIAFMIYWLLQLSRTFFLSFIILVIGFSNLSRFYKLSGKMIIKVDDIKVMSYNVRMFNKYEWIKKDSIPHKIALLIEEKAPDILCLQEYTPNKEIEKDFPYNYIVYSDKSHKFGQAILSNYKIISKGNLQLKNTGNNILFADLLIDSDTIRVYNIHLQSLKINPNIDTFNEEITEKLRGRISKAFTRQQYQVEKLLAHQKKTHYTTLMVGDFNNTPYSWAYRSVLKGRKDAYVVAGKGFDVTYEYPFPIRIDFIMLDKDIKVNHFKAYRDKLSDHYPILARIDRKSLLKGK